MGQIWNRLKFVVRSHINPLLEKIPGGDFIRGKINEANKWREEQFEKEWKRYEEWAKSFNFNSTTDLKALNKSYGRLGLEIGADFETVRVVWKKLIRENHPDRFTDPNDREKATVISAEINEAYQTIEKYSSQKNRKRSDERENDRAP